MNEVLHPVKDAARCLGISVWTLRRRVYQGSVASVKIGAKLLIAETEIERIIREGLRPRRRESQSRSGANPNGTSQGGRMTPPRNGSKRPEPDEQN